jgi:hypothetical protein
LDGEAQPPAARAALGEHAHRTSRHEAKGGFVVRACYAACLAVVAVAVFPAATASAAGTDDDPPGATDLTAKLDAGGNATLTATLESPGDRDWYAITGSFTQPTTVTVRRSDTADTPTCPGSASLQVELLNPEQQWIATQTVSPATSAVVPIPSADSRYFVGVSTSDPACSGIGYVVTVARTPLSPTEAPQPGLGRTRRPISNPDIAQISCGEASSNLANARDQLRADRRQLRKVSRRARRRIRRYIRHDRQVVAKWRAAKAELCNKV